MFLEILTKLMNERNINKNILSKESGVPYNTIDGFYKKGCDNVKLSTLEKLSRYFGVSIDYLVNGEKDDPSMAVLSPHELEVIKAYRDRPEMQNAVDTLLHVSSLPIEEIEQKVSRIVK